MFLAKSADFNVENIDKGIWLAQLVDLKILSWMLRIFTDETWAVIGS